MNIRLSLTDLLQYNFGYYLILHALLVLQVGLLELDQLLLLQLAHHVHLHQRVDDEIVVVLPLPQHLVLPVGQHPGEGAVDHCRRQQLEEVVLPVEEVEVHRQVQVVHAAEELHERSGERTGKLQQVQGVLLLFVLAGLSPFEQRQVEEQVGQDIDHGLEIVLDMQI
jgi:hypothetical protein